MRIAIVGGGASGLVAGYLLGNRHEVHLFESAPNLGGHVRTLGQNVKVDNLPPGKVAENGPLGFHVETSPTLMRLLTGLRITSRSTGLGSNLFLRGNRNFSFGPGFYSWPRRYIEPRTGGLRTAMSLVRFLARTRHARSNCSKQLGEVLPDRPFLRDWFRCVVMMCLSTPAQLVDSLPVWFAVSNLRHLLLHAGWAYIPGGMYSYQARLLSRLGGTVYLNSPVDKVFRDENGVKLSVRGRMTAQYDKMILATPPGEVLSMVDRPTAVEARCFSGWERDVPFRTIAHTDMTMYEDKSSACPTPADYFERDDEDFGYNSCVSSVYSDTSEFSFAYNLDDLIQPARRLDSHEHLIPAYSHAALQHRDELISTNGASHTYYAGAWLGSGMHEGAVSSASRVAHLLGERSLEGADPPRQPWKPSH